MLFLSFSTQACLYKKPFLCLFHFFPCFHSVQRTTGSTLPVPWFWMSSGLGLLLWLFPQPVTVTKGWGFPSGWKKGTMSMYCAYSTARRGQYSKASLTSLKCTSLQKQLPQEDPMFHSFFLQSVCQIVNPGEQQGAEEIEKQKLVFSWNPYWCQRKDPSRPLTKLGVCPGIFSLLAASYLSPCIVAGAALPCHLLQTPVDHGFSVAMGIPKWQWLPWRAPLAPCTACAPGVPGGRRMWGANWTNDQAKRRIEPELLAVWHWTACHLAGLGIERVMHWKIHAKVSKHPD